MAPIDNTNAGKMLYIWLQVLSISLDMGWNLGYA